MAFGKDPNHLSNVPGYGASFAQRGRSGLQKPEYKKKGARTGNIFYWKDCYKPNLLAPDILRIIPGKYTQEINIDGEAVEVTREFYEYIEHHNGKSGAVCSGGCLWAKFGAGLPCLGCKMFWEDVAERKAKKARGDTSTGPRRVGATERYAFPVWDYGTYIEVIETDATGAPRLSPKTGQPYKHWEKGDPNDLRYRGMPWKNGHLLPWSMSKDHYSTLIEWSMQVGSMCKSCGTRQGIQCVAKMCSNEACNAIIYSPQSCTLTLEQREKIDHYPYTCPSCQQTGYVAEKISCQCVNPVRAQLWDVDLMVKAMPTQTKAVILQLYNYSEPRPIHADPEVLKTIVPPDLARKFAPTPVQSQGKMWGIAL